MRRLYLYCQCCRKRIPSEEACGESCPRCGNPTSHMPPVPRWVFYDCNLVEVVKRQKDLLWIQIAVPVVAVIITLLCYFDGFQTGAVVGTVYSLALVLLVLQIAAVAQINNSMARPAGLLVWIVLSLFFLPFISLVYWWVASRFLKQAGVPVTFPQAALAQARQVQETHVPMICPVCGYDLRENQSEVCPECGLQLLPLLREAKKHTKDQVL